MRTVGAVLRQRNARSPGRDRRQHNCAKGQTRSHDRSQSGATVTLALVASIHVFLAANKAWMAGTSPAMTLEVAHVTVIGSAASGRTPSSSIQGNLSTPESVGLDLNSKYGLA